MKIITAAFLAAMACSAAFAEQARVLEVQPMTRIQNVPSQRCSWVPAHVYENRVEQDSSLNGGTVAGAVIGGLLGRSAGNSTGGRDRGTVAGAVLGGVIGNQLNKNDQSARGQQGQVQQCTTSYEQVRQLVGYNVAYEYNGRTYTSVLSYDPGMYLEVEVIVRPAR